MSRAVQWQWIRTARVSPRRLDGVIRGIGREGDVLFVGTLKGARFAVPAPTGEW